jgi:hypothetical protein
MASATMAFDSPLITPFSPSTPGVAGDAPLRRGVHSRITTRDPVNEEQASMPRLWPLLALTLGSAACAAPATYTIADANITTANERAARYCSSREATAQLEQVRHQGDSAIQVYRCVASE